MQTEFAPAKINLCLHVTGQRADGYHLLDSLVVFCDVGDQLRVVQAQALSLTIDGPQAPHLAASDDNLVLRAARLMGGGAAIQLTKNLPLSSGIGGGSADAAATLRALARLTGQALPDPAAVLALGADVPVCLAGVPLRMQGVGEQVSILPSLPELHILLVNPGVAVATPTVFKALTNKYNPPLSQIPHFADAAALAAWLADQRNDLEPPAIALNPVIAAVKAAIAAQPGCLLARMSGSGATCFGLFASANQAKSAEIALHFAQRDWWHAAGRILPC